MKITKELLRGLHACKEGKDWFKNQDSDDLKDLCMKALEEDHFDWCNWVVVRLLNKENKIRYAVFAAESVLPIFEREYPGDKRPRLALEAAKKYLENPTEENRKDATANAAAADAAAAAADASYAAAHAAYYAADAAAAAAAYAADAAYYAAYYAADAAADAAAAAHAAYYAADAAYYAAYAADCKKQVVLYGINLIEAQK